MKLQSIIAVVSLSLMLGGIAASATRVAQLERREIEYEGEAQTLAELEREPDATRVSARLATVNLKAGQQAVFEICSRDSLQPERWLDALQFAVWKLRPLRLMLRVPLDREHLEVARRSGSSACLTLGSGPITSSGRYAVDTIWIDKRPPQPVMQTELNVRVMGFTPLTLRERLYILAIALGALLGLTAWFVLPNLSRPSDSPAGSTTAGMAAEPISGERGLTRRLLLLGLAGLAAAWTLVGMTPLSGAAAGLAKSVVLASAEIGLAIWLARKLAPEQSRLSVLALSAPSRARWWALGAAVLAGILLSVTAKLSLQWVPATGEAPIQTFVSWPSGMLSYATLGMIVPLGEEVFFRGFVYRAALRWGKWAAFAVTATAFTAVHVQQTWGNWGGLTAVLIAAVVLTDLRARTGSTLAPAVAHLVYNLLLSMASL